jgi:hypothetical protein
VGAMSKAMDKDSCLLKMQKNCGPEKLGIGKDLTHNSHLNIKYNFTGIWK